MPYQDFDPALRERQRARERVRFKLGGKTFTCVATPSLLDTFDLLDAPEPIVESAPVAQNVRSLIVYIEKLLLDRRQVRRFRKVIAKRDSGVDALTIIELGSWLAEQYAGRPTVPSSNLSDGRPQTEMTSNTSRFDPVSDSVT